MLVRLFGKNRASASRGIKPWKQLEKKGLEAESNNALNDARKFYATALEELSQLAEGDRRHERYFAFKISQIRFALERVKSQLQS
jgi:hypothetical protein